MAPEVDIAVIWNRSSCPCDAIFFFSFLGGGRDCALQHYEGHSLPPSCACSNPVSDNGGGGDDASESAREGEGSGEEEEICVGLACRDA